MQSVLLVLCVLNLTSGTKIKLEGQSLTAVPWEEIPDDCRVLSLNFNDIESVSYFPETKTKIEKWFMEDNKLTSFPDLRVGRAALLRLSLKSNRITSIDPPALLADLVNLWSLRISHNPLVAIPDPSYYPATFRAFWFGDTDVQTLPNFCFFDTSGTESGKLLTQHINNPYLCDAAMVWTKIACDHDHYVCNDITCSTPATLADKDWANVTIADLMEDYGTQRYFVKLADPAQFYCYPNISAVSPEKSQTSCAVACSQDPACVMFAVDGGQCVLTEVIPGLPGTRQDYLEYSQWWIVDVALA